MFSIITEKSDKMTFHIIMRLLTKASNSLYTFAIIITFCDHTETRPKLNEQH